MTLLEKYLKEKNLSQSQFSRLMKANPASVHAWVHGKGIPRAETAWKIHRATKGEIPITYWGYAIINGKFKRLEKGDLEHEK